MPINRDADSGAVLSFVSRHRTWLPIGLDKANNLSLKVTRPLTLKVKACLMVWSRVIVGIVGIWKVPDVGKIKAPNSIVKVSSFHLFLSYAGSKTLLMLSSETGNSP
jgi:hypothetical protein